MRGRLEILGGKLEQLIELAVNTLNRILMVDETAKTSRTDHRIHALLFFSFSYWVAQPP